MESPGVPQKLNIDLVGLRYTQVSGVLKGESNVHLRLKTTISELIHRQMLPTLDFDYKLV